MAWNFIHANAGDASKGRSLLGQAREEFVNGSGSAFEFNHDASRGIADISGERVLGGEAENVRTEPNSLNNAGNFNPPPDFH
jgi:hypothetical protein